jgi:hypothetical protein
MEIVKTSKQEAEGRKQLVGKSSLPPALAGGTDSTALNQNNFSSIIARTDDGQSSWSKEVTGP